MPARPLTRKHRRSRSSKRIEDYIPTLAAIPNRALHNFDGLLRGMQLIAEGLVDEPNITFIPGAAPVMSGSFPPAVEDRFILPLVIRPAKRECLLRPDEKR